jgi:hypothetical protein
MESRLGFFLEATTSIRPHTNKAALWVRGVVWCGVVWGFLSHGSHGAHLNVCKRCRDACADAGHQAGPITRVAHDGGAHLTCQESGRAERQGMTRDGNAAQ